MLPLPSRAEHHRNAGQDYTRQTCSQEAQIAFREVMGNQGNHGYLCTVSSACPDTPACYQHRLSGPALWKKPAAWELGIQFISSTYQKQSEALLDWTGLSLLCPEVRGKTIPAVSQDPGQATGLLSIHHRNKTFSLLWHQINIMGSYFLLSLLQFYFELTNNKCICSIVFQNYTTIAHDRYIVYTLEYAKTVTVFWHTWIK